MKKLIGPLSMLCLSLVLSHGARAAGAAKKAHLVRYLPRTAVLRISKRDPSHVEIAHLDRHLAAGKRVANLPFQQVALNSENHGIAKLNPKNELDGSSSKSSFGFALGGYHSGYHGLYGGGGFYGGGFYNLPQSYLPVYNFGGYQYNYRQYWGYEDADNTYAYCDPGLQYGAIYGDGNGYDGDYDRGGFDPGYGGGYGGYGGGQGYPGGPY